MIKCTIHPKPNEIGVITTSKKYYNMLAQHCTGGLYFSNKRITPNFKYRYNRESNKEIPVLISDINCTEKNRQHLFPFIEFAKNKQSFLYVESHETLAYIEKNINMGIGIENE